MVPNHFFSLIIFIFLSHQSNSKSPINQKSESLVQKSRPQILHLVTAINEIDKTFSNPVDYFDSRVTIKSCQFLSSFSEEFLDGHIGGAIYFTYCETKIHESLFDNCAAFQGGAIFANNTHMTIIKTNFSNNIAVEAGGAIVLYRCANFTISGGFSTFNTANYHGCFDVHESNGTIESHNFISNTAESDCACVSVYESQVIISKCYFIKNEAEYYPASIQVEEGEGALMTSCIIRNCYFIDNEAGGDSINFHFSGNISVSIIDSVFDVELDDTIMTFKSPKYINEGNKIDRTIKNPFESSIHNKQEIIEFSKIFDHTKSNYIAGVFIITIPIYAAIVFFILIKD